jgi:ABC-type polysaccharide/polyol phosphate transport system ATPase subunit
LSSITLENVVVDFPLYGLEPSFRTELIGRAVGGLLKRTGQRGNRVVVRALDRISLQLRHGDLLGLVGHNGAGKSTLLRVLAGIYEPSHGRCTIEGRVSPLFLTAPGLDFDESGYENIITCGRYLGMSRKEIKSKINEIDAFAELGQYLGLPVRTYSAGMVVRLGFAIATAIDPEILLLDEGLGAGDARFADRARGRVEALIARSNIMVLASHSNELIRRMCNRAVLLDHGQIVADGTPDEVLEKYREMQSAPLPPAAEPAVDVDIDAVGEAGIEPAVVGRAVV